MSFLLCISMFSGYTVFSFSLITRITPVHVNITPSMRVLYVCYRARSSSSCSWMILRLRPTTAKITFPIATALCLTEPRAWILKRLVISL